MMSEIGIGLIGCGGRLKQMSRKTCRQDDRLKIKGIYDTSQESIDSTKKFFSIEGYYPHNTEELQVFNSVSDIVTEPSIDWVMVGSYNSYHCEHVVAAFKAGKNVFCEKPLATSIEDCIKMRDAWKASGKQFLIGFTLRFSPFYRKIKNLIEEGIIGNIISLEFNETLSFNHGGWIHDDWRSFTKLAGTHLLEKCSHDIDLVNWMVESRSSRVASFGDRNFFIPSNAHHMERLGKNENGGIAYKSMGSTASRDDTDPFTREGKDIIDNQVVIMEYENNVRATFHTNCNSGIPERRMVILGTEGTIRGDVLTGVLESKRIGFNTEMINHTTGADGGHGGGDQVLATELKDCMLNGGTPAAGLIDGLTSAITCFGIDQAMTTGQVIDMKPLWEQADLS
jgi:predicted dehydrogenase